VQTKSLVARREIFYSDLMNISGKRISRINKMITMANTPSLKASKRDFSIMGLIIWGINEKIQRLPSPKRRD
jgi:hypothetical protein